MFSLSNLIISNPCNLNFSLTILSFGPSKKIPSKCLDSNSNISISILVKSIVFMISNSAPSTSICKFLIDLIWYFSINLSKLMNSISISSISSSVIKNLLFLWFKICCLSKEPMPLAQCLPNLCIDFSLTKKIFF